MLFGRDGVEPLGKQKLQSLEVKREAQNRFIDKLPGRLGHTLQLRLVPPLHLAARKAQAAAE